MRKSMRSMRICLMGLGLFYLASCQPNDQRMSTEVYPDQTVPGDQPELFAEGMISTGMHEHSAWVLSPKGDRGFHGVSWNGHKILVESRRQNGLWHNPEVASFSGKYRDEYPFFSPDGKTLFFNSFRPDDYQGEPLKKFRHWKTELSEGEWGAPEPHALWHADLWPYSMDTEGNVYGWGGLEENRGGADIYVQYQEGDGFGEPVNLGDSINSEVVEYCPFMDPQSRFLVFGRMGLGEADGLYISYALPDGKWTKAVRLPETINAGFAERFPAVSPDGKYLFFNRQSMNFRQWSDHRLNYQELSDNHLYQPENGNGDIWWADISGITE